MPTKLNRAGEQQNYVPAGNGDASGEYGNDKGGNKHFANFKKQEQNSFDLFNKKRIGKEQNVEQKEVPATVKAAPKSYDEWEKALLTQERVGNPPEEIETRLEKTPIIRINEQDIKATKEKYPEEIVNKAAALIQKYEKSVDETAADLQNIADGSGGLMIGLAFRLKRLGSLSRKIEADMIEAKENGNPNPTVDDAIANMKDTARFTMMFRPENFENDVKNAMDQLAKNGYKMVKAKNTFYDGAGYKGLNCNFIDKKGNIFELQFHIPQSMAVKEGIVADMDTKRVISDRTKVTAHDIYETTRVMETNEKKGTITPEEKQLYPILTDKSKKMWATVPNYEFAFLKQKAL